MLRRIAIAILALAVSALLLVLVWPQGFGFERDPIIAQVVALRGVDVAVAFTAIVVLLLLALVRPLRAFAFAVAIPLAIFALVSVAILGTRGFSNSNGSSADAATKSASSITVLSWNTKGSAPGAERIARLAIAEHADVIALPETTLATGIAVEKIMHAAGEPMWVLSGAHGYVYQSHATTLLVSARLGKYTADNNVGDTSVSSTVVAKADNGTGPTFIAVHAVSPKPEEMANWRSDVRFLSSLCNGSNLIMAGDFNATLDHLRSYSARAGADFGSCTDAGAAGRAAAIGSWPTNLPELLGAQIDHVMYGSGWKLDAMHVIGTEDSAGSDHRPVVATLVPANP